MTDIIKRWEVSEPGINAMRLVDAIRPEPLLGEVLVRVGAVALNYRDLAILEGTMGPWSPHFPGSEMAGEVVAVGPGVARFSCGDRVIGVDISNWIDGPAPQEGTNTAAFMGRLADYVTVPEDLLVRAPSTLDLVAASTLAVAGLTAWFAVVELGRARAGEVIVVQGTGGVALFAVQFAVANGAIVIVTSSSEEKLDRVRRLGSAHGINRKMHPDWDAQILEWTSGRGADHMLEIAGGDITRSLNAIRIGGRISIIGLLESLELSAPTSSILFKRAQLVGIGVGHRRALEDMIRAIDALKIQPVIDAVYPFAEAPAAFAHLKRGAFGKIVIRNEAPVD